MGLFSSRNRGDNTSTDSGRDRKADSGTAPASDGAQQTQTWSTRPVATGSEASSAGQATTSQSQDGTTATGQTAGTSTRSEGDKRMATIGQSIIFKGELSGDEDLEIEGQVDGNVNLQNHQITVGANGRLKAEVQAKSIIVIGQVIGNLTATERIEIQATGVVEGDLRAPRLNVQEGAVLNGSIDMSAQSASTSEPKKPAAQPQAQPAQGGAEGEARKTA